MSNDYQSGAAPSAQKSHAELIAEQLTNIESLGDGLPAVIAAGALRKLLRHLDEAHTREIDEIKKQVADLQHPLIQVGNAAKLRNAAEVTLTTIKKCMDILNSIPSDCGYDGLVEDVGDELCGLRDDFIKAALAAPPRNCDVYSADELKVIFKSELVTELPIANEHEKNLITITAMRMIDTLLAPATEKEGGDE